MKTKIKNYINDSATIENLNSYVELLVLLNHFNIFGKILICPLIITLYVMFKFPATLLIFLVDFIIGPILLGCYYLFKKCFIKEIK